MQQLSEKEGRMNTKLVSVREAAQQTGQAQSRIRRLIREKELRVIRVGYHILIPRRELRKLVADGSKD